MKTHGELRFGEGRWGMRVPPHVAIRAKRLFARASQSRGGIILLKDTAEVARDLEWFLDRYPMIASVETLDRLHERAEEHRRVERDVHEILGGRRDHLGFREPARPARDYQTVAADLALATGRLLLCDELGLGKTMSGLLVLLDERALPCLVVCPTHLPSQWEAELAATLPWLRCHLVRSGTPYDPASHRSMGGVQPDVLVMGYSKLRGWGDHLAGRVRTVIFDEAQELRRGDSQKWTAAAMIADQAEYRIGLTATPVYNYAGEIHSIFSVLAPEALGSRDEFMREWGGSMAGRGNVSIADPGALGTYLRDEGLMLRRTRAEVGRELPDVIRVPHLVDTDEDLLEQLLDEAVDLAEMIVAQAAPRQELWHAHGEFDWRLRHATGIAKAGYVAEFVRMLLESDEQVVLFGWHRDVYDVWRRRLAEYQPAFYTGTESTTQKRASRDSFLSGDSRVLVMSLRAGTGLDGLQEASHVAVFGELDWSPGIHDQDIGRLQRDGQSEPVLAYFLVSDHGTDPPMAEVLNLKRQQSEPLQDPDAPLLSPADSQHDRVRQMAADLLAKRRAKREKATGTTWP